MVTAEPSSFVRFKIPMLDNIFSLLKRTDLDVSDYVKEMRGISHDVSSFLELNVWFKDAQDKKTEELLRLARAQAAPSTPPPPSFTSDDRIACTWLFLWPIGHCAWTIPQRSFTNVGSILLRCAPDEQKWENVGGVGPSGDDDGFHVRDPVVATSKTLTEPSQAQRDQIDPPQSEEEHPIEGESHVDYEETNPEKKRELVASAFGDDENGGSQTRLTVEDMKYLFQA
ncbi:hypothetical protein OSB04_001988 [Centaurea solstitialis]|uniref:Uncharacterized protein n=1 Tax=Centaurea solstitialis TaxID=347529 RepID=A0AA38UA38_9ASTR|nr:hypothetical protein OSB04_001988 [Centaurea solstitialis]